jgi:hypothetical protein
LTVCRANASSLLTDLLLDVMNYVSYSSLCQDAKPYGCFPA